MPSPDSRPGKGHAVSTGRDRLGKDGIKRAAIPYVLLHDGILGVFLPGREEGEWSITIDGVSRSTVPAPIDRFAPIGVALPREVEIRDGLNGAVEQDQSLGRRALESPAGLRRERAAQGNLHSLGNRKRCFCLPGTIRFSVASPPMAWRLRRFGNSRASSCSACFCIREAGTFSTTALRNSACRRKARPSSTGKEMAEARGKVRNSFRTT
jgi:hypothetical protein